MKPLIITLSLIGILVTVGFFFPHFVIQNAIVESVIIDKTDSFKAVPTVQEVLLPVHIDEHRWDWVNLRMQCITGNDYNTIKTLYLQPRVAILSNPDEREREISAYRQQVASSIDSINGLENGKPKSSIYATIVSELNSIALLRAHQKSVIVYSDLMEHSRYFSVYDTKSRVLLQKHPEQVKKLLERSTTPTDLTGIDVYFIFRPKSESENDSFALMSNLFKSMFVAAGAMVYIGANVVEK